jgi:hypothetical protein
VEWRATVGDSGEILLCLNETKVCASAMAQNVRALILCVCCWWVAPRSHAAGNFTSIISAVPCTRSCPLLSRMAEIRLPIWYPEVPHVRAAPSARAGARRRLPSLQQAGPPHHFILTGVVLAWDAKIFYTAATRAHATARCKGAGGISEGPSGITRGRTQRWRGRMQQREQHRARTGGCCATRVSPQLGQCLPKAGASPCVGSLR